MDGGRRLLRSLKEAAGAFGPARPAMAGVAGGYRAAASFEMPKPAARPAVWQRRGQAETRLQRLARIASIRGVGLCAAVLFFAAVGLLGAVHGGQYAAFLARNGSLGDILARAVGLGLDAITISGAREISGPEVLAVAGVSPRNSLLLLDVDAARERLRAEPMIADASVRKLYPNRLVISIVEREPAAIWQKDGKLALVAQDGAPIADMRDARYADLPFVVGEGANQRIDQFRAIVAAVGDLRGARVTAGVFVGQRRWNLKISTGLEVKLPEEGADQAAARLGRLARDARLLDKDLLYVDLRVPGRMFARLTDEAAATRAEKLPKPRKRLVE